MTDLSSLIADIARNEIPDNVWEVARSLRNVVNWQSNGSIENIAKVLIAFSKRDQWQPIETAPKDQPIIGYWEGYKRPCVMWWNAADGAFESWADRNETPSHWMPLPSPPRALQQKGSSNG